MVDGGWMVGGCPWFVVGGSHPPTPPPPTPPPPPPTTHHPPPTTHHPLPTIQSISGPAGRRSRGSLDQTWGCRTGRRRCRRCRRAETAPTLRQPNGRVSGSGQARPQS